MTALALTIALASRGPLGGRGEGGPRQRLRLPRPPRSTGAGTGATDRAVPTPTALTVTRWSSWRPLRRRVLLPLGPVEDALHIIACESMGIPTWSTRRRGPRVCSRCTRGWHLDDLGFERRRPFDPHANVAFAAWLWKETGGWSHWHCRPDGMTACNQPQR